MILSVERDKRSLAIFTLFQGGLLLTLCRCCLFYQRLKLCINPLLLHGFHGVRAWVSWDLVWLSLTGDREEIRYVFAQDLYLFCDTIVPTSSRGIEIFLTCVFLWSRLIADVSNLLCWTSLIVLLLIVETLSPFIHRVIILINEKVCWVLDLLGPLSAV